jgi:hypothetical protein
MSQRSISDDGDHAPDARFGEAQSGPSAIEWLRQVADDQRVTPSACRLAIVLSSQAAHGFVSVSQRDLAAQTRCTPRGVGKQMAGLVATGHIHVNRGQGRGRRNRYHLVRKRLVGIERKYSAPCLVI